MAENELASKRPKEIQRFLLPLASGNGVACADAKAVVVAGKVFAAHDGVRRGEYRDWRFSSKHRDIRCGYFELWRDTGEARQWSLDRAYLTLFLTDRTLHQEREILCVHADPNNADPMPMQNFKKGPHLHVKHREDILCHAHFPMTIGYIDQAIGSVPELTRIYNEVASLLSIEVVGRFADAAS
jgi:hypothetical protein